jgi:CHRD domain
MTLAVRRMAMKHFTMIAALAGAAVLALPQPALAEDVLLGADMAGSNETAGGDADGEGRFSAQIDANRGSICYSLRASKIAEATMAHIHSGADGANGPPVATLKLGLNQCMDIDKAVLRAIVAAPGDYYVNVHNAEFPAGAVRGQLVKE